MRFTKPLRWAATVVLAATVSTVGLSQPASASPIVDYIVPIGNLHTWEVGNTKVMAVSGASTSNLAPLIQYGYSAAAPNNDKMVFEREGNTGLFRLKPQHTYSNDGNVHNDKCLAVQGNTRGNNIAIVNATCTYDSINNDVWTIEGFPGSEGEHFVNFSTGKCIATEGASTANNARLITYDCNGSSNSEWFW